MKYIAKRELKDEDWMTQAARKYGNIPKGAEVEYIKDTRNLYGCYAIVQYKNNIYYVKHNDLEMVN